MRTTLSIFLLFTAVICKGQFLSPDSTMLLDTTKQLSIGVMIDGFVNSDAINARLVNGFIQGGYITREERQNMLNRANQSNVEGGRAYGSIFFTHRIDSFFKKPVSGVNLFIQAKHRIENYSSFSKNALELAFFGNKPFAGKNTQFAPLHYTDLQFQQFQLGLAKQKKDGSSYYISTSLLIGQKARTLLTNTLSIHINQTGDTLGIDAKGAFEESNPGNNSLMGNNGIGASIDFGLGFPVNLFEEKLSPAIFNISVTDLGFISWHPNSQRQSVDTSFTYLGSHYTNIFDPSAAIFYQDPGLLIDSLSSKSNQSFVTNLPATINFAISQKVLTWKYVLQGTFRSFAYYKPFFAFSGIKTLAPKWNVGAQLNTGGYGTFGGGLFAEYTTTKSKIQFGSHQMEGFILPNHTAGQQLFILYSYSL